MRISSGISTVTAAFITAIFLLWVYNHNIIIPTTAFATDNNGVIMYYYPCSQHSVYNPLILAGGGLSYLAEYQNTRDSQSKQYFINTANWLLNNATDKGGYSIWEYDFT